MSEAIAVIDDASTMPMRVMRIKSSNINQRNAIEVSSAIGLSKRDRIPLMLIVMSNRNSPAIILWSCQIDDRHVTLDE